MAAERELRVFAQRRPGAGDLDVLRQLYIRLGRGGVQSVHPLGKPAQFLRRADKVGGLLRSVAGGLSGLITQFHRNGLFGLRLEDGKSAVRNVAVNGVSVKGKGIGVVPRTTQGVGAVHVGRNVVPLRVANNERAALRARKGEGAGEGWFYGPGDAVFIYGCPLGNGVAAEVLADFKVGQLGNQGIGGEFINGTIIFVFEALFRGKNLERFVAVICRIVRKIG